MSYITARLDQTQRSLKPPSDCEGNDDAFEPFLDNKANIGLRERRQAVSATYYGETESHQFEQDESEVWKHHQLQRHFEDKGHWWTFAKKREIRRWLLTLITGLLCGITALFVTFFTKIITKAKFKVFNMLLEKEKLGEIFSGSAFIFFLCFNIIFGFVAWLCCYMEPLAAGSGIPEVKCFLNGLNIPRVVRVKTLIYKAVGIIFSCSSGLPLGKEGPMVHAGAVIAAAVSQGRSTTLGFDTAFSKFQDFRNDKEKRDFVACGAAAGVAAAFGAPIGGVLFSLEESASFWSTKLTWRCFFCAMMTIFTVYLVNTANSMFGHSDSTAMFSFGEFFSLQGEKSNYSVWELSMFMLIGSMGGLIGTCFISANSELFKWRRLHVTAVTSKMLEVFLVVTLMSTVAFVVPLLWNKCTPLPVDMEEWNDQEKSLVDQLVPLYCPQETHYNELASLYLTDSDTAIKQLFHFREIGDHNDSTFSSSALFLFLLPYIMMACVTPGLAVPAGMFVPSLLSGAAFGRLVGHLLHKLDNTRGTFADSGTYALMGAAAITAGITRMTISLTVMILEATGDMQYVLPLMLTVMTARLVGNVFTEGLYDVHIHSRDLYFLDEDENISHLVELHDVTVSDIMTKRPICVRPVVRVGDMFDMLQRVKHHCFPIVDERDGGALSGTITRKVLCTLMKHKAFGPSSSDPYSKARLSPLVNWGTLECIYPNYPEVEEIQISELERMAWLDLRPYIDYAAHTINENASVQKTYRMFRTLGLRHLCVVNKFNQVLGVITRADLVSAHVLTHSTTPKTFSSLGKNFNNNKNKNNSNSNSNGSPRSHALGSGYVALLSVHGSATGTDSSARHVELGVLSSNLTT